MSYNYQGQSFRGRTLTILRHNVFSPQVTAPLETSIRNDVLSSVNETIHSDMNHAVVRDKLNSLLANSLQSDISRGYVADIEGGWNEKRHSFMLVVDVYEGDIKIAEEILQGYVSLADFTMGNLYSGATVRIDPNAVLNINRAMQITYNVDNYGNYTPHFSKSDSILVDNTSNVQNTARCLNRPSDLVGSYHNTSLRDNLMLGDDSFSPIQLETISDSDRYNSSAKLSDIKNEVGGRILSSMIESANNSKTEITYTSVPKDMGLYENMMMSLVERDTSDYYSIRHMNNSRSLSRSVNITVGELEKVFPGLTANITTVESYNDNISKTLNSMFNFNGTDNLGLSGLVNNQINIFQKKLVPFMFERMMSLGFVSMSGTITNKTLDGSINVSITNLNSITNTVNGNSELFRRLTKLLIRNLSDSEARVLISGGTGVGIEREVEIVFDMSITDSVLAININGNHELVRIPSMCDSLFSSIISTNDNSVMLREDIKNVVDNTLGLKKESSYNEYAGSMWD